MLIAELAQHYKLKSNKAIYDRLAALEIKLNQDDKVMIFIVLSGYLFPLSFNHFSDLAFFDSS